MANDATDDVGLVQRAETLLKDIRSHARRVSRAKNLLAAVKGKEPSSKTYTEWLELERGLGGYELGVDVLDAQRAELIEALGSEMKKLRIKARMAFMQKLEMGAQAREISLEKLSEAPLVLHADPLTFEIDFDAGSARLLYGHEPICELGLDARELLDARQEAVDELDERAIPSDEFFDRLRAAYGMVLAADGAEKGARVDLVDVLVPLAVLGLERKDWRNKGPGALEPYPRHLLAWQLAKLRRDGVLERGGVRLDLGAATGGSTRNKQNVLYIPVGAKSGQYYGSLRFG